jgi:hypothetical protein
MDFEHEEFQDELMEDPCGDPRCDDHAPLATSYKQPITRDVQTDNHQSGAVTAFARENTRLTVQVEAETHSCTGPVTMHIRFDRELLHELHVGPEVVEIELAEAVE